MCAIDTQQWEFRSRALNKMFSAITSGLEDSVTSSSECEMRWDVRCLWSHTAHFLRAPKILRKGVLPFHPVFAPSHYSFLSGLMFPWIHVIPLLRTLSAPSPGRSSSSLHSNKAFKLWVLPTFPAPHPHSLLVPFTPGEWTAVGVTPRRQYILPPGTLFLPSWPVLKTSASPPPSHQTHTHTEQTCIPGLYLTSTINTEYVL